MPLFGPPDVRKLGAKGDVPGLIKALRYKGDSRVRWASVQALSEIADSRAVEPLIVALGDADKDVRSEAALALGKISDRRAVEPLIVTLGDREKDVRIAGALSLGRIGDPRAIGPLTTAVDQDPHDWVRLAAGQALEDLGVSGMVGRAQSRRLLAELRAEGGSAEPVTATKRSSGGRCHPG
jgi:DEAD/DEAH box helicase domain-containing protein